MSRETKDKQAVSPAPSDVAQCQLAAPTEDEIRIRAYEIYCARSGFNGTAEQDWLEAESALRAQSKAAAPGVSPPPRMSLASTRDTAATISQSRAALQLQPA